MKYKKVLAAAMAVSVVLLAGVFTGCGSAGAFSYSFRACKSATAKFKGDDI